MFSYYNARMYFCPTAFVHVLEYVCMYSVYVYCMYVCMYV